MAERAGTTRLEAFSDGVIAVIITIMVLEIKVPHPDGLAGLRDLAAPIGVFMLSFWFTACYWLNHQHIIRRVQKSDHALQCTNLLFLFCLSLLPFSTAYAVDKQLSGFAVAVYAATLMVVALAFMTLRLSAHRHLKHRGALSRHDLAGLRNHVLSILLYATGTVQAFYFPRAVVVALALLTLLWMFPNLTLRAPET